MWKEISAFILIKVNLSYRPVMASAALTEDCRLLQKSLGATSSSEPGKHSKGSASLSLAATMHIA